MPTKRRGVIRARASAFEIVQQTAPAGEFAVEGGVHGRERGGRGRGAEMKCVGEQEGGGEGFAARVTRGGPSAAQVMTAPAARGVAGERIAPSKGEAARVFFVA